MDFWNERLIEEIQVEEYSPYFVFTLFPPKYKNY